ncbi:MAG: putative porin [Flavobacteriaceae bacterium]|nr:putative porin [Flavobacteriaceae bacterium]
MRIPLFVLLLLLKQALWSQQEELPVKDTIPSIQEVDLKIKDTLKTKDLTLLEEQKETSPEDENKKPPKKKRYIPYIKSMDEITVSDYKIMYLDGTEKVVDTSLSLEGEYTFNFLREDYFEYLPLPNMGEGFNKLGYNFHDQPFTPQMGARVKHFGYFEKEDIPYYEVPSAYTELFFKSTFQQGQFLDTSLAINTSPKFNIAVSFRGFRSLGKYVSALSRSRQFRLSTQYQTYNQRYRLRMHQTTQSLENEVNGGLTNDSVYFFENAPNYVEADESGNPVLDEDGNEQIVFYDGFLDRNRLGTQIQADNVLEGKRYFMEHRYQMLPVAKDTTVYKIAVGYSASLENKKYKFNQNRPGSYFLENYEVSNVRDSTSFNTLENKLYIQYKDKALGQLQLDLYHHNWDYSLGPKEYEKDTLLSNQIKASQLAAQVRWEKELFGFTTSAMGYQSLQKDYATQALAMDVKRPLVKDILLGASYKYRSQPLNFNFYLAESDYKIYNWDNTHLENQQFNTRSVFISHPKWGRIQGEWTSIDNFTFLNNTTRLRNLNEKFSVEVLQTDKKIDYFKARLDQRIDFGNFSWVNNVQYQKVNQEEDPDAILSGPVALNVPEWLIRSTLMLTSSIFNKALFFQTGATFVFFTDYYADQYNPLLAEFVTQNNTKIGEYPRVDFFFNAKIKSSRIFLKLENISAPIEHLIDIDTPYDYYAAPFVPYRDFSIRFGLIWNFFE